MGALSNLLRWKKPLDLKDEGGSAILDDSGNKVRVWVRIITDKDLEDSFLRARIASARMRANLLNDESDDYKALVEPFDSANREQCYDMALAGLGANWMGEALSSVERPDLPKISEVAKNPDAPTLEEQEKLDALISETETKYKNALQEFINTKNVETSSKLDDLDDDQLRAQAKVSVIITIPLEIFLQELEDQKMWRAVFMDEDCKIRGYESVEDYRDAVTVIKEQITELYSTLEAGHSEVKN